MANLVTYAKQVWQDAKTAITAARLNNMEQGINDCATQINALGGSVSRTAKIEHGVVIGSLGQSSGDVVKIAIDGSQGQYVFCINMNKSVELYDRGEQKTVWRSYLP